MGQFWVEWDLPADRDMATFWRFSVGESVAQSATRHSVEVRSSFRYKRTCCHNKYGIGPSGGGFPTTNCNGASLGDLCMQVAVMSTVSSGDGFHHCCLLFDAPISNSDWPNRYFLRAQRDAGPPFLSVWLR